MLLLDKIQKYHRLKQAKSSILTVMFSPFLGIFHTLLLQRTVGKVKLIYYCDNAQNDSHLLGSKSNEVFMVHFCIMHDLITFLLLLLDI